MREVVHHASPDAFLAAAEPLLARNPAVRAFVAGWAATWRDDPRARPTLPPRMATAPRTALRCNAKDRW